MHAPVTAPSQQPGLLKNAEMFRDGRQGHRMRPCEIGDAPVAPGQMRQDSTASRISERSESLVQCSGRIFNHLVNYLAELLRRANILLLQFTEGDGTP
jgi:hypothetical protein